MSEEQTNQQTDQPSPPEDAWGELGRQFRALGENLAAAVKAAVENEETRRHMQELQQGLKAMINEVDQAVRDAAASPEVKQAQAEVKQAAQSARTAGEQVVREAQPHLLSALRQVNTEIQKIIDHLEQKPAATAETVEDKPEG